MIGRLRGTLIEKLSPEILIECAGVGYEVSMPMTSIYALPELDQQATIYTHFVVREDAQLLYGFANKVERKLFRLLIKVNGVGPKLALAILSNMSADQFVSCVRYDDVTAIVKIPGVGKKTAERLAIYILRSSNDDVEDFTNALQSVKANIDIDEISWCFKEDSESINDDKNRDDSLLCLIKDATEVFLIEKSGYRGHYHVLGGLLSPKT